jgi:N-acetylneuraminic acid mutarotase
MRQKSFLIIVAMIFLVIIGSSTITGEEIIWVVKESKMPTARSSAVAAVAATDIYTLGGHGGSGTYSQKSGMRENEVYHISSDSWEQKAPIPYYRGCYGFATGVVNNQIFMFGGANPPGSGHYNYINMYDIASNTWNYDVAYLPYPVTGAVAVEHNGYIYVFGGRSGAESGSGQPFRKIAIKFAPNTYNYTYLNELPVYRSSGGAFIINDLIYIIGGITVTQSNDPYGTIDYTPPILVYDPENDSWTMKGEVPIGFANPIKVNETIYLITRNLSIAYKYNVANDSWTLIPTQFTNDSTGGFLESSCFAAVGEKIYFIGGTSSTTQRLNTVIEGTIIQDNSTPTVNAGEDITINSDEVTGTIISGTALDEDTDDILEYRWKKDEVVLMDWTPVGENGQCLLDLGTTILEIGGHILILEVTDGEDTSSDDMILIIENSSPKVTTSGSGIYEVNTDVILIGSVSDYDGDLLNYSWMESTNVLFSGSIQSINGGTPVELPHHSISTFSLGMHTLTLRVDDGINDPVSGEIIVEIVDTTPPTLSPAANKTILWPPNHKMVDIVIEANASDNSELPVTLIASIDSNEPINGQGDGDTSPDWTEPVIDQENGIIMFQLRAERSGKGNGRVYTISITATDTSNNSTTANVSIIVPHNNKKK